ncbi:MAG: UbiD family decarboxylase, partial [Dehalococcoidia bacterium]
MATKARERVSYDSMREYMQVLDERGLLKHVTAEVDLDYEIGAISYRDLVRGGPGLLFENVKDYPGMPLVTNIMYSLDQLAIAFNGERDWAKLEERVHEGMRERLACNTVPTGPVKEVMVSGEEVDLSSLPTPLWHELDGGRYIATTAGVVTIDPKT